MEQDLVETVERSFHGFVDDPVRFTRLARLATIEQDSSPKRARTTPLPVITITPVKTCPDLRIFSQFTGPIRPYRVVIAKVAEERRLGEKLRGRAAPDHRRPAQVIVSRALLTARGAV